MLLISLLHFRYRYKQCDIQTSKFTAMSTSLTEHFFSFFFFLEAPYPIASRWVRETSREAQHFEFNKFSNASQHPMSFPNCLIQGLVTNEIHLTLLYWRWLQKCSSSKIKISIVVNSSDVILAASYVASPALSRIPRSYLRSKCDVEDSSVFPFTTPKPAAMSLTGYREHQLFDTTRQKTTGWRSFCW